MIAYALSEAMEARGLELRATYDNWMYRTKRQEPGAAAGYNAWMVSLSREDGRALAMAIGDRLGKEAEAKRLEARAEARK